VADLETEISGVQRQESEGSQANPWFDPAFNTCELSIPDPGLGIDDIAERTGIESAGGVVTSATQTAAENYWKKTGSDIYYDEGSVGIGKEPDSTEFRLHALGDIAAEMESGDDYVWLEAVGKD
jgi:hypothetical protein